MLIFIPLASLLLLLLLLLIHKGKQHHKLPPGPKKLPLIGNLHQLGSTPHRSLWLLSQKHGPLMHLQLGPRPTLVVSSAEMAREVLKTHDLDFCSRPHLIAPNKYSYNSSDISFAPYGEYWREMRKVCTLKLFSAKRVESFRGIREEEVSLTLQSISSSSSKPINLQKAMVSLANNIICRIAFGKKYQDGEHERSQAHQILKQAQQLLGGIFVADFFPALGLVDKLSGNFYRLEKNVGELDAFYEEVIRDHLDPERIRPEREDIVDVLLRVQQDEGRLTKENIKAVLTDIFIAGSDTSAATIIWAMAELVRTPRAMKKTQDEVRALLGSKEKVEEGDLHQLQYLKAVVKETLRLHTPAPLLLPRETIRHCKIEEYDILPNTLVYINAWGIGRDPNTWQGAEEFMPERFMNSSIDFKGHDFQFIPFGSGRRICPAMNVGVAVVELALANMLYLFDWELPEGMKREDVDMEDAQGLTVHKRSPLYLVPITCGLK
ncbi:uncharacterized protein A4U43_C09F2120 [Asparagus officinalis]|uniref:Cytochrome P450 n=1 Tax=Asparagus officinalis TaxID=4686 RepID=A0A5P1E7X9_ASPOF|nr:cytochrome P450 71A9-like [Asparagus officinalis]ONK57597.1 uncharacterized protein A4U43_C09F2120 [Asparagus officinalis]